MRGVKYVTYAFLVIVGFTIMASMWLGRYQSTVARRHTDTFLRILSSCSILLMFVFYYNLVQSEDEARVRAEEQDNNHELDRRSKSRMELVELYKDMPNSVLSIVELQPRIKYMHAHKAVESEELHHPLAEYMFNSIIFDLWLSQFNMFVHREPSMVAQVATITTQALSPVLRMAWAKYSYQYSKSMRTFVNTMYEVIDDNVKVDSFRSPNYEELALLVLQETGYIHITWHAFKPFYVFKEVEYAKDKAQCYF